MTSSEEAHVQNPTVNSTSESIKESASKVNLFSSIYRHVHLQPLNGHCYLRETTEGYHYNKHGIPTLLWYSYVTKLRTDRTHLTVLHKLYQHYHYTKQFLFKLKQFLVLQNVINQRLTFYQTLALSGEACKLPKLNVLCKQTVSLLNDLDSCSMTKLTKLFDNSMFVSMSIHYKFIYDKILADTAQCIQVLRKIIIFELKFCYLFSNYRSRLYSFIDFVIKYNDAIFHPTIISVLGDKTESLVINLNEIIDINIKIASKYIARSLHYKMISAHAKSTPILTPDVLISSVKTHEELRQCKACSTCKKLSVFLHKYCNNKYRQFIDAMSVMLQGAGDNRIVSRTDTCTSSYVQELLLRHLTISSHQLTESSVFYESGVTQERYYVSVHEFFSDQNKKCRSNKHTSRWDSNHTSVIYVPVERGFPNTWISFHDINNFQHIINKLINIPDSTYSEMAVSIGKNLLAGYMARLINSDQELLHDSISTKLDDSTYQKCVELFSNLSFLLNTSPGSVYEEYTLLFILTQQMLHTTKYLIRTSSRVLRNYLSFRCASKLFNTMYNIHKIYMYLHNLHQQISNDTEREMECQHKTRVFWTLERTDKVIQQVWNLLQCYADNTRTFLNSEMKQLIVDNPNSITFWKQNNTDEKGRSCIKEVLESVIKPISRECCLLPDDMKLKIHHHLANSAAAIISKLVLNNKKISFSKDGLRALEDCYEELIDFFKSGECSIHQMSETITSTQPVKQFKNDVAQHLTKKEKPRISWTRVTRQCNCEDKGNWKRRSAPELCSKCNKTTTATTPTPLMIKPASSSTDISKVTDLEPSLMLRKRFQVHKIK